MSHLIQGYSETRRASGITPLLLTALVCLAFFALWSWNLGYPSLSGDESFVAILTSEPAGEILRRLNSDEPHPPVYYLMMRLWYLIAGNRPEFLVRYPSLLVGLLLLSLTYRLGRDLGLGWLAAVAATLWLGFNPHLIVHVREARMYGPMVASLAFAALIALRFERLPHKTAIGIAAAASLLALLTHYFNVLFVIVLGLWGTLVLGAEGRRRWLLSQGVAWALFALWMPFMGRGFFNPSNLSQGKTWSFTLLPWDTLSRLIRVGVFGYRDTPALWLAFAGGVLLIGSWLAGCFCCKGRRRWFLLLGAAGPLMIYALLGWFKPVFHPKYILPWLLFAALALGCLIARRPWLGGGVTIVLLALMALPMWRTVWRPYDPGLGVSSDEWLRPVPRQLTRYLVEHAGPTDVFGLGTPDPAHCYYADHYFERSLGCALLPKDPIQSVGELERQIDELLAEHTVLWYLDFYNPYWDPHHVADEALAQRALSLGAEEAAERRLRLYTRSETVLRRQQAVGVRFGEVAELEGIWLMQGGDLHVVLVWHSLADRPPVEAKVFLHLVDETGQVVVQDDSIPVWWTRPLETWRLDEQVLDAHVLSLPAGASLTNGSLFVGLYDPDTLVRLSAYDRSETRLPDDTVSLPLSAWISFDSEASP